MKFFDECEGTAAYYVNLLNKENLFFKAALAKEIKHFEQ